LLLFAASVCRTQALFLANDLADRSEDSAAGKDRWVWRLSPAGAVAVVVILLATGAAILLAARKPAALAAYAVAAALLLFYSVRPIRFKGRGLAGLIVYSAACVAAYVAVPWAWFGADWVVLVILMAAVFMDRWVNLHFHQVADYEADVEGGNRTYAARVGLDRARRTLQWAAALASLTLGAALAGIAALGIAMLPSVAIGMGAAVAAGLFGRAVKAKGGGSPLVRELPCHYLGLTFALFRVVPPLLIASLALAEPTLWIPAGLAAATSLLESRLSMNYRNL
jgi:4-hydroxybenzoate polyprenyltransferase